VTQLTHAGEKDERHYDSSLAALCYLEEMAQRDKVPTSVRSMVWAKGMVGKELLQAKLGEWGKDELAHV
jgi:hypothetical protein